jgi:hypothetical protein
MYYAESADVVVQECRFLLNRRDLTALLPDIDKAIPPLTYLEFLDTTQQRTMLGYPLCGGATLLAEVHRLVVTELGLALADPERTGDAETLSPEALRQDSYVRELTSLLVRTSSHGEFLRLDSVLWLQVARAVAGLLNHELELVDELREALPREAAKGERYLVDLLRLKGTNPRRYAEVKNLVLRALFARSDFAISSVAETLGDVYGNPIYREMVGNRLAFTEKPAGLYSFFDLREAFSVRPMGLDLDLWLDLNRTLRAVAEEACRRHGQGKASAAEAYLVDRFVTDELLDKAGRLDIADVGTPGAAGSTDPDDFPIRVAWLLCLQPEATGYLFCHLDQFNPARAAARRFDLGKDFLRQLKSPGQLAGHRFAYKKVLAGLLGWDFFNTLRGFIRDVRPDEGGRLLHGGNALRSSVVPIDLSPEGELYSRRRHGTAVYLDIAGFTDKATELLGHADPDFAALCIQQLLQVRRTISLFRGRPQYFTDGRLLDVFPRALDALRYVGLFRAAFERNRQVHPLPWGEARGNPFAEALRVGIASGDYVVVTIPEETPPGGAEATLRPVGRVLREARTFVDAQGTDPTEWTQEYDPLEVFTVHTTGSELENGGIASSGGTFREVAAAVRLEGLAAWSPAEPDVKIAGRRVAMKNYRFQLIFDDPPTGQVVLVRRLDGAPSLPDGEPGAVFEYLLMWPDAFQAFLDRVHETEKHQPALRRRAPIGGPMTHQVSGPVSVRRSVSPPRRRATAADPAPPGPAPAPLPPQALNLPDEDDFQFPDAQEASEIEARLGLTGGPTSGLFSTAEEPPDLFASPPDPREDDVTSPQEDILPAGEAPEDELSGSFDWGWSGADDSEDELTSPRHLAGGGVGASDLPEPDDFLTGLTPGSEGEPTEPSAPAPHFEPDPAAGDEPIAALPFEEEPTEPSLPASPSLLGTLGQEFAELVQATEQSLMRDSQVRARPVRSDGPRKERLKVPRPDFHVLFKDYVYFWVGPVGEPGAEFAIGRRYRDVFFDLHRFQAPADEPDWGVDQAIRIFLRAKIRSNFVPQSLSYEALPSGAGDQFSLTVERLENAFDAIT